MDLVRDRLRAAQDGHPGLVLITGEPGIGKTRLIAESLTSWTGEVLTGSSIPVVGSAIAYGPWLGIFGSLPGGAGSITGADGRTGSPVAVALDPSRAALLDGWYRSLAQRSRDRPLVVVLEDLHWADDASLELLAFTVRRLTDERLLVIATARPPTPGDPVLLRGLTSELLRQRNVDRVHLTGLDHTQVAAIVSAGAHGASLADAADRVDRVYRDSGGNPFLAVELAAGPAGAEIPRYLRDVMFDRLSGLEQPEIAALRALAIVGRPTTHLLLGEVVRLATGTGMPPDGLRQAIAAGIVTVGEGAGGHRYAYRHGLLADAVVADLAPGERLGWHRAVATALSATPFDHLALSGEVAEHWFRADVPAAALTTAVAAGREAISVVAPEQADLHLSRAVELWPRVDGAAGSARASLSDVLGLAAAAKRWLGDTRAAIDLVERAGAAAESDLARAELLERLGRYRYESGDATGASTAYDAAAALLTDAEPTTAHAQIEAARASLLLLSGRNRAALALALAAAGIAGQVGGTAQQAYALVTAGAAAASLGDSDAALTHLGQARVLAQRCGAIEEQFRVENGLCVVLDRLGRLEEALEPALRAAAITRRYQLGGNLGIGAAANALELLRLLGRWTEFDQLERMLPTGTVGEQHLSFLLVVRAELDLARGNTDVAQSHLDHAQRLVDPTQPGAAVPLWNARAALSLWRNDPESAWSWVTPALDQLTDLEEPVMYASTCALAMWAIADSGLVSNHDDDPWSGRLQTVLRRVETLAGDPGLGPQGDAWLMVVEGERTRCTGDSGTTAWATAAQAWAGLGCPYPRAYALWRLAEANLLAGKRPRAAAALVESLDLAKGLGAEPLVAELVALGRRSRLAVAETATVTQTPGPGYHGLTEREFEVLRLVTDGLTNREIARRLFISERTAGVHVSHILTKLGVGSRVQAASLAHREGAFG